MTTAPSEDDKAEVLTIVTDMGNGGRSCGKCHYDLDGGDPFKSTPEKCPKCNRTLFGGWPPYINSGGSDF